MREMLVHQDFLDFFTALKDKLVPGLFSVKQSDCSCGKAVSYYANSFYRIFTQKQFISLNLIAESTGGMVRNESIYGETVRYAYRGKELPCIGLFQGRYFTGTESEFLNYCHTNSTNKQVEMERFEKNFNAVNRYYLFTTKLTNGGSVRVAISKNSDKGTKKPEELEKYGYKKFYYWRDTETPKLHFYAQTKEDALIVLKHWKAKSDNPNGLLNYILIEESEESKD